MRGGRLTNWDIPLLMTTLVIIMILNLFFAAIKMTNIKLWGWRVCDDDLSQVYFLCASQMFDAPSADGNLWH